MPTGRIEYERVSPYSNKTYIGNWVEERCRFEKEKHQHISTYMQDFDPKPNSKLDADIMWDSIFKGSGVGARILFDHNGNQYIKNFSTLYDLSYNHFPKMALVNPVHREWRFLIDRWEPEQDFLKNYGNITDYGITTYKKQIWEDQRHDLRITPRTEYNDSYIPPSDKDRQFKRWAIPLKNSSLLYGNNMDTYRLQLRDMPTSNVTPNEELVVIPRECRCNPITWECHGSIPKESKRLSK